MLSAFTARPIVELKQRNKSKIESILAYGDRLVVGLNDGSLRIYRVNEIPDDRGQHNGNGSTTPSPAAAPPAQPVDLLRDLDRFSTRPIEQLARIKEAGILISLSNSYIYIHDLQSYSLQEQLVKTKNASTFAVTSNIVNDTATGVPEIISRLAVAVKRRLLFWSWHEAEMSPDVLEITLAEPIRTLTWSSATKLICGMNSGYVIVDVTTREVKDIKAPGAIGGPSGNQGGRFGAVGSASMGYMGLGSYIPKPLVTKLNGEMLLAKDINSLFITPDGEAIEKRQIPWQYAPDMIGYSYPYTLALQAPSKGSLEVRNPETLSLLQTISLPNANQLHFPPSTVSLAHAGKSFHVASERCIWQMQATDYDSQIDELVTKGLYDEAISILNMLEDALLRNKTERLSQVEALKAKVIFDQQMEKAQMLFDKRKYSKAVDIFIAIQAPPEKVIRLYPKSIAGDLSIHEEKNGGKSSSEVEDNDVSTSGDTLVDSTPEVVSSPKPAAVNNLLKAHLKPASDASMRSFLKFENSDTDTASIKAQPAEEGPLEGKDLVYAARELSSFLVDTRTRLKKYLDAETGQLLPKRSNGQNGSSDPSVESLLSAPKSDTDKDREKELKETAKLVDTTLFRSYMLSQPQLAGALFRLPNFCDPDVVNEKLYENGRFNDLVDFFHGKKLHRPALELLKKFGTGEQESEDAPTLKGPQRTIGYLQNLPPDMIDLILEFAEWPLRANPELGMEIFLADTENAETLPRDRVATFLEKLDVDLAVKYLWHVINELNDMTPEFHNRLVGLFLQELKGREDRDTESWGQVMQKLIAFLHSSKQYSFSRAFGLIPKDDPYFYEAQAIVLSELGNHKQALEIYVFKLQDYEKAEEYCHRIHLTQETDISPIGSRPASSSDLEEPPPSIYHTLLSLYLTPPPPHQPNWAPALELLSRHGSRLPAASTLNLIPATLPIADLESYFRGRIRAANSIVNEARVVAGLRKSEVVSAQANLLLGDGVPGGQGGRNRRVVVGEERVCGVCHKRLGGSVIAVLADNSVVHYGCLARASTGAGSNGQRSTSGRGSSMSWR